MKPQQANIQWCLEHRDLLAAWLEKRGRWRPRDRVIVDDRLGFVESVPSIGANIAFEDGSAEWQNSGLVWIPDEGDALEMLEKRGVSPELISIIVDSSVGKWLLWYATDGILAVPERNDCHKTSLIALLELLRETEADE